MKIKSAYSTEASVSVAVQELMKQLESINPKLVLYFASSIYEPSELSSQMESAFPDATVVGCSTAGEITSGKMLDNGLVASAYAEDIIENLNLQVVENIRENSVNGLNTAFQKFEDYYHEPMAGLDYSKYVGMVLFDGLSGVEEVINDMIGNRTSVSFVGGSAGDDLKFKNTYLYANGKPYQNAVVLLLIKPRNRFTILKTQSFDVTDKVLIPTKVNEAERRVIEFNNQPATKAYAEAIGVSEEDLPKYFSKYPIGLVLDNTDPFVRSPQRVSGSDIFFYCSLKEGFPLHVLKGRDIVAETKSALEKTKAEFGEISGLVNFNCILRTLELKDQERTGDYGNLFSSIPTVGFSTYGETYIGHVNQTATMLVLK